MLASHPDVAGLAEKVFGLPGLRPAQREAAETLVADRDALLGYKDGRLTVVFDDVGYKELLEDTVAGEGLLRPVRD
ncbi:hypothetical protein [Actinoallomurus iriomotensis]|uniref:Uncharacterized protein n=1 Tax=Actinoallomurus iriomotensis TaxID=478107 RepID=A0A9W6RPU1_9ACTN|nr:hypothetical protein [Actinoallomurus iriomotensis]GLY79578.1 hypothetical protein Airi01_078450 [Actinoallomurus iriomotensis]